MITATKEPRTIRTPKPKEQAPREDQPTTTRKDRIMAIVMLLIFTAFFGLIIWLASLASPSDTSSFDYMMYW